MDYSQSRSTDTTSWNGNLTTSLGVTAGSSSMKPITEGERLGEQGDPTGLPHGYQSLEDAQAFSEQNAHEIDQAL
jgi:hypothetical protein